MDNKKTTGSHNNEDKKVAYKDRLEYFLKKYYINNIKQEIKGLTIDTYNEISKDIFNKILKELEDENSYIDLPEDYLNVIIKMELGLNDTKEQ